MQTSTDAISDAGAAGARRIAAPIAIVAAFAPGLHPAIGTEAPSASLSGSPSGQKPGSAPASAPASAPVPVKGISAPWFFAAKLMGLLGGFLVILFVVTRGPKRPKHNLGPSR